MPNIARTNPRPIARAAPAGKTKILLVRQPVKSVRRSDEPDRAMYHLSIGVIVALGSIAAVWVMGFLGYRLGFAPMMRVPELMVQPADALVCGALTLISIPQAILQAGITEPMALMLGFVLISIPAASLGAIKPRSPGGPRPKPAVVGMSYAGAIAASLNALGVMWWMVSPFRHSHLGDLPIDPSLADAWLGNLQTIAGLDVLAVASSAVWVVVIMRLAIPMWLRGLSGAMGFFALVVIAVAMSMSNVSVAQMTAGRSVIQSAGGAASVDLVLGFTPQYFATLRVEDKTSFVDLRDRPTDFTVVGKQSVVDFLSSQAPKEE